MQYNKFGKLTSISQGGITEHRVYDGYQNLCKTVRPDVGNTAMSIDAVGNTTWLARGSSVSSSSSSCDSSVYSADKISYSYDNLGALKTVNYGDSTPTKTYSYDRVGNLTNLSYDGTTHSYAYNDLNLLTTESLSVDGYTWSTTNNYNSAQQISSITYPSNSAVSFNPNALGQAKQVGSYASSVKYHANGQLKSMTQGSYCSVTQSLKTYGVPDTQRTVCRGNTALYNQYHYDGNLNVTFWDDKQSNSYDLRFTYDGLDRLDVIKNGSYTTIGDMDYDAMGNITKFKFGSNQVNYSYDSTKKLASTWGAVSYSMSYDDRGNVLGNGQKSFTYNLANQMTQGHGNSYRYDGHDRRVKSVDSKGTRYSFYTSSGKLIFESINGTNRENYYLGSQLVAYKNGTTVTHIHSDLMGSTAATSNSAGAVLTRSRYKPFGNEWGTAKNEMGYTGHKFDTDLGLSYMQARYYDPMIGRFYSNDPIGFRDIHSFNRYAYANNNPYKYVDPTGMCSSLGGEHDKCSDGVGPSLNSNDSTKNEEKYSDIIKAGSINIEKNYNQASEYGKNKDLLSFVNKVKTGGDWDYKSKNLLLQQFGSRMQEFGNWHFGIVANGFGFNLVQSTSGAGAYQNLIQGGGSSTGLHSSILINVFTIGGVIMPDALSTALTNVGFSWGDNPNDARDITEGWFYADKSF